MSVFPQIGVGVLAQLPLCRTRKWKSIENRIESAERIRLADPPAGQLAWRFSLQQLTDTETEALRAHFVASQGRFGSFLFVDPMANLLGWSEDFSRPDWQRGLLTLATGAQDPQGTHRASSLTNPGAGPQTLQQNLAVPGSYVACFSAWIRSAAPGTVSFTRDGRTATASLSSAWARHFVSAAGVDGALQSQFSIGLQAGQTVDIWGAQVEAQPYPSMYKQAGAALGIYEETYFGADELKITHTGPGLSSCDIVLASRA